MNGIQVALERVKKNFGPAPALGPLDLTIAPGDLVAILGPSGCGKSTLLRLIAGLENPTEGRLAVAAPGGGRGARRIAYVFQDAHLLPWRNVLANAALPLELSGVAKPEREAKALEALRQMGLSDAVQKYPAELSGGMRMRVSLARALVTDPELLLLDEPFASLDEVVRQRLGENLRDLWRTRKMTVVLVTHSLTEAAFLAERVVILSKGPGRIVFDRRTTLPPDRTARVRAEVDFARNVADFYQVFEKERMLGE